MSSKLTVDATLFRAKAKKLVKQLKLDEHKVVKEQAGMMAELMTKVAPPFKKFPKFSAGYANGGAQGAGVDSVKSGFFSAVQRVGSIGSWKDKNIRKAIRAGDTNYLEQRFKRMKGSNKHDLKVKKYSDRERDKSRNRRGRVSKTTMPFVALSTKDVNQGLKRAVSNVGIAKASLAKVAVKLGRKNPPKWISRHFGKVNSVVSIKRKPVSISFRVSAKGLDVVEKNLKRIERFRMNAMTKRLESLVRANAKKAGFKVR